ncbi:hypothetical protein [Paraburkholderia sp. XV]|uniref:hypothetical protein n=1 Tax=Paraburkholderia sp. XV TaxID=2831520 RepID=UPI001CD7BBB2|nr:hypothetical protein [Paraburkholderia sp. XV]
MLEHYHFRPETVDRIRLSWLAPAIEEYVTWLTEAHYTARSVLHRVPVLVSFGEYAKARGARDFAQLSDYVEPFVQTWICRHGRGRSAARRSKFSHEVRNPICQMLRLVVEGYDGPSRPHKPDNPFEREAPLFMAFLVEEKRLRPRTILHYRFHLHQFATYLERNSIRLQAVSPTVSAEEPTLAARCSQTSDANSLDTFDPVSHSGVCAVAVAPNHICGTVVVRRRLRSSCLVGKTSNTGKRARRTIAF